MGQVGGHTGSIDDIVEGELVNRGAGLEQQRKGLAAFSNRVSGNERIQTRTWPMPPAAPRTTVVHELLDLQACVQTPTCFNHCGH